MKTDPFVAALRRLCESEGGYKQVAVAINANDQSLYQIIAGVLLPSGKPRGVGRQLRERLDRAFPGWMGEAAPSVANSTPQVHASSRVAHTVSLEDITVVQDKSWDDVMREKDNLPERFEVAVPDDSMAPEVPRGHRLTFQRGITPVAGDGVLVASEAGAVYIRKFRERSGGRWLASPVNPDYAEYDSESDKLRVLAVAIGRSIPGRLSGAPI